MYKANKIKGLYMINELQKKTILKKINYRIYKRTLELNLYNKNSELYKMLHQDLRVKFNVKKIDQVELKDFKRVLIYIGEWNGGGTLSRYL
ncbi:MAG: ORF6C domain-containing protein [Fusobacteriaceae bacterium]